VNVKEIVQRATEGDHPWGFVVVPNVLDLRRGWARFRLVVFPPGTSVGERRALTLSRRWPVWGALVALAAEMLFGSLWSAPVVTLVVVGLYLFGVAIGQAATRRLRRDVRSVVVAVTDLGGVQRSFGDAELYRASVAALDELDLRMREGELTPVGYEAGWAAVYTALGSESPVRPQPSTVDER
jgi:hypothetical protein